MAMPSRPLPTTRMQASSSPRSKRSGTRPPVRYHQDKYGRVHTNLTNLPKRLRQFLVVDGSSLSEIDVPNSQPLFFGVSLNAPNHKLSSSSEESSHNPEIAKLLDQLIPNPPPPTTTPLRSRIIKGDYLQDVSQARFYEALAEKAGMQREEVKAHVLRYFYCDDVLWGQKGKILRRSIHRPQESSTQSKCCTRRSSHA